MNNPVSRNTAPHYKWGQDCDGWRLVSNPAISVIEERVPPGAKETLHYHKVARQFFYIISGSAVMQLEGHRLDLAAGMGIEVAPMARHRFENASSDDVVFLVISSPSTQGDRYEEK
jgi:mannose-6-phosphate isomerase-like protein (cupin superfamily)